MEVVKALIASLLNHELRLNREEGFSVEVNWIINTGIIPVATLGMLDSNMPTHEHVIKAVLGEMVRDDQVKLTMNANGAIMVSLNKHHVQGFRPDNDLYRQAVLEARVVRLEEEMEQVKVSLNRCATRAW